MQKGFDYWSRTNIKAFLWVYWISFLSFYIWGIWLSFSTNNNPFVFAFVSVIPYFIAKIYRKFRKPKHKLRDRLQVLDPEFYEKMVENSLKIPGIKIGKHSQNADVNLIMGAMMQWQGSGVDERIQRYIRNIRHLDNSGMYSLSIWFLTLVLLSFLQYFLTR